MNINDLQSFVSHHPISIDSKSDCIVTNNEKINYSVFHYQESHEEEEECILHDENERKYDQVNLFNIIFAPFIHVECMTKDGKKELDIHNIWIKKSDWLDCCDHQDCFIEQCSERVYVKYMYVFHQLEKDDKDFDFYSDRYEGADNLVSQISIILKQLCKKIDPTDLQTDFHFTEAGMQTDQYFSMEYKS